MSALRTWAHPFVVRFRWTTGRIREVGFLSIVVATDHAKELIRLGATEVRVIESTATGDGREGGFRAVVWTPR